jgi:hypothetical protein
VTDAERKRRKALSDRKSNLKRKYGMTLENYEGMLARQGGRCAICRKPPKRVRLAVDHDHRKTGTIRGRVRGLLCTYCNKHVLGNARGWTPQMFRTAADYLENPPGIYGRVPYWEQK